MEREPPRPRCPLPPASPSTMDSTSPTPPIHTATPSSATSPPHSITSAPPASPCTHPAPASNPATSSTPTGPPPRRRGFADLAKRVVMQERIKKVELEASESGDKDEDTEECSIEEIEKRAKSGDARAQTTLGRHYLELAEKEESELNNRLAVDWLVQAARQGHRRAARLLQQCWVQRKGLRNDNEEEVRRLSTETRFEQAIRKAAMLMFCKLNPDGKKRMAVSEMLENVGQVNAAQGGATTGQTQKVLERMVTSKPGEFVDLNDFVEITRQYAQGITPTAGHITQQDRARRPAQLTVEKQQSSPVPKQPKRSRSIWGMSRSHMMMDTKRHFLILQYPLTTFIEVKDQLIDWLSRAGVQWLSAIIPTQHVNALIFFFIISNLTVDLFAFLIPLIVFYLAFISMVICTLRIFQSSKAWENFSTLTALLTRFEPGLDVEQAESDFGWNNLEPYLYFMLSVFFVIFSFPVADKGWIPCSELSTVAILFTAVSYKSLNPSAATYAKWALVTEVASSVCSLTSLLPESAVLLRKLSHTFAILPLGGTVVLKLSLPCLLYAYLFYRFFSMARQRGFRGTYCFLVPYLVCFMWCEFSVVLLQNSSPIGLIRTCVAYFLFLFALPVLAVGLAAMALIHLFKWFLELELTKMIVTLAVCAVPVTLRLWTRFGLSLMDVFRSMSQRGAVKLILCCITMVMVFFWMYVYHSEGLQEYNSPLTWRQYGDLCGPPAWKEKGVAQTQIFCTHLDGHQVTWNGRFRQVRVAETENGAQSVINLLPVFMGEWLRCLYGETYPRCDPPPNNSTNSSSSTTHSENLGTTGNISVPANYTLATETPSVAVPTAVLIQQQEEEELCVIKALAKHKCHVKRFDSYILEVGVGMPEVAGIPEDPARDIKLVASHEFRQVLLQMEPGSLVEFSTTLKGRLGGQVPSFELKAIHCLDCESSLTASRQVKIERDWRRTTLSSFKFAFDFFFSPFLSAQIDV